MMSRRAFRRNVKWRGGDTLFWVVKCVLTLVGIKRDLGSNMQTDIP